MQIAEPGFQAGDGGAVGEQAELAGLGNVAGEGADGELVLGVVGVLE